MNLDSNTMSQFTDLSSTEIRHAIDETQLALGHLVRSQSELGAFLAKEDDNDFRVAHEENKAVFVNKRIRLRQLIEVLQKIDVAAYMEKEAEYKGLTVEYELASISPDDVQLANEALASIQLNNGSPIEIIKNGVRQTGAEVAILQGTSTPPASKEKTADDGLYL